MRLSILRGTTGVGALLTLACAPAGRPLTPSHAAAMQDSVRTTLDDLRRYSAAGQWDSMAGLYDGDSTFRWAEEGVVVSRSAAQIRRKLTGLPAGMRFETGFSNLDIAPVSPGAASVVTGFQTSLVDSSGTKFSFGGVLTMVLVHRAGGWRILTGHSSTAQNRAP